jgi:hypothetical protein
METQHCASFLNLCQELRDIIYNYALDADFLDVHLQTQLKERTTRQQHDAWTVHYDKSPPAATFLSLLLTCRQMHHDLESYLCQKARCSSTAKLELKTAWPHMVPQWTSIPRPPAQLTDLHITVKISNLFDPALSMTDQHRILLRPIFEVLQRYVRYGPYMSRQQPLLQPLKIGNVRIALFSAIPLDEMTWVFGNPGERLEMLHAQLKPLLARLARSGMVYGAVESFELSVNDQEPERMPVTANMWNEEDYVFFDHIGFRWTASWSR